MLQIRTKRIAFLSVKCYVNSCARLAHTNNTQSESCGSPVAMIRKEGGVVSFSNCVVCKLLCFRVCADNFS